MENYDYAIAQLNVSMGRLSVAIDKWENEILQNGPFEEACKMHSDASEKFKQLEAARNRLLKHDYDIITSNGICPYCKCPIGNCSSDHK